MIITKTPFRLPLAGGGTDLPAYYQQYGTSLITASINKYMYVFINRPPVADKIRLHYSQTEDVNDVGEIKHGIIKACLKHLSINDPIEITSMADFAAGTGMGSSSAFTVALLSGLYNEYDIDINKHLLANTACHIEMNVLGSPIGKQDQYASTYGGINELIINKRGSVKVIPLKMSNKTILSLEKRLLMFYTGLQRDANDILAEQGEVTKKDPSYLRGIYEIGLEIKEALLGDDVTSFGRLLHKHWMVKRRISGRMTTNNIDMWYQDGMRNGAIGGKIMGAGGGGLLLFCAEEGRRSDLCASMLRHGLRPISWEFEFKGVHTFNC